MQTVANSLRQRLWRWHFFAGLMVCPFMILLAVTGSIYLFKAEIEAWEESGINARSAYTDTSQSTTASTLSEGVLLNKVLAEYPGATFDRLTIAKEHDQTVEFDILPESNSHGTDAGGEHAHHAPASGEKLTVWVDRYSGEILEAKVAEDRFLNIVKDLHGKLLLGDRASYIVELVASWAIILLISGVVLWSHKTKTKGEKMETKPLKNIFSPKIKEDNKLNARASHGAVGIYIAIPLFVILITGLPWTQLWGGGFKQITDFAGWNAPKQVWFVTLKSSDGKTAKSPSSQTTLWQEPSYSLGDVVSNPALEGLIHPIHVKPPKQDNGVWSVRSMSQNRSERVTLHFDQHSGRELMRIGFNDNHPVQRVVSSGISLHEGALFGLPNKILVLITALLTIGLSVLGLMSWWKRRHVNSLGVPTRANQSLPMFWVAVIIISCLLLPVAGISLIVAIGLDYLWSAVNKARV